MDRKENEEVKCELYICYRHARTSISFFISCAAAKWAQSISAEHRHGPFSANFFFSGNFVLLKSFG